MFRHTSVRTRFIIFALICLIPLLIVIIFFLDRSAERSNQEIISGEATISTLVTQSLANYINSRYQTIERLSSVPVIQQQDDIDAVNHALGEARALRPEMSGIFLINTSEQVVGESGTDVDRILPRITDQIESTLTTGQRTISGRIELADETNVIVLLAPVTTITQTQTTAAAPGDAPTPTPPADDNGRDRQATTTVTPEVTPGQQPPGTILGVVGAVVQIDTMTQSVIPVPRTRADIAIVSSEEVIAATGDIRQNGDEFLRRINEEDIRAGNSGTDVFQMTSTSGMERLATFAPVPLEFADWAVVVSFPVPSAYGDSLWLEGGLILALAAIAVLAIAVAIGEYTARPLRDLARDSRLLLQGDYSVSIQPNGSGEILSLSTALAEIGSRLSGQMTGLEQSHQERQRQTDQMRELLRRTLRLQEDERRRIAGEIHDAVSPLITGALYQARALQMANGSNSHETLSETLQSVNSLLERASEELHGVIFDLRPPDLDDIGVVAALEAYVSTIQRTGLQARLEVINDLPPLTPEVRLGIYRIVQEALHNVVRHASADEAVVRIEFANDLLRVTIRDNGAGFTPGSAVRPTSLGMLSMRERAAAIGASFSIISKPGGGTAIVIERTETGNVMSDEILDDLIRHRDEESQVVDVVYSSDNTRNEDASSTSESDDEGRRES
jgi:signal transduction histidine kinase